MNSINDRRDFLKHLSIASLAAFSIPMLGAGRATSFVPAFTRLEDENYWEMVKKQFAVPDNLIMMNAANLCPAPYPVNERVMEYSRAMAKDVSFQYREVFAQLRKKSISMLSGFVGADPEEIGITRNTSEANCIVVQGLDFSKGDEIIIWEQNHPSNHAVWLSRAKRYGLVVKTVAVPEKPASLQELIDPFMNAITTKTRLIAFSHISNLSGIALPAKEICQLAHARGIMTLVDGAQALGFLDLDLHDLGCTFYTSSTHKWLMGPFENGLLYVRKEYIRRIWPIIMGGGWKEAKTVDENVCVLGQRNETTTAALPEILEFHQAIGKKNIEARVVQLNTYLKAQIKAGIPTAEFVTPYAPEVSGGIVIVNLPGKDPKEVTQWLYEKFGIACAPAGGIRLSPHIYNTKQDVDRVVRALVSVR
jgi:isopenicillin-N epimerase